MQDFKPPKAPPARRPQVKICGLRDPLESQALDALGIDWIGFNFHPSSARYIAPEAAVPLIQSLRQAKPVGVFVDLPVKQVLDIIKLTGILAVQLHGHENWEFIQQMPIPVIKAIPHLEIPELGGMRKYLNPAMDQNARDHSPPHYFLVDTQSAKPPADPKSGTTFTFGGSGQAFDWNLLSQHPWPRPYFLAGGLGPENLGLALKACTPFAIDLNSKVEFAPGQKDIEKVKACLRILNEAVPHPQPLR